MTEPKIVWAVFATFPDGERHLLKAFAKERDARLHLERATYHPMSDDGRDVLLSAIEVVGIRGLSISPIRVY